MNKKPDDTTLTQWIDGELQGEELRRVDAWAKDHPELLTERDAIRLMNAQLQEHLPASVDPPYPDFFNQRILRTIEEEKRLDQQSSRSGSQSTSASSRFWQWLAAPMAAAAMAICFFLGAQFGHSPAPSNLISGGGQSAIVASSEASVYTPDGAVHADVFTSAAADATVIVLEGLADIPDEMEMAGSPVSRPSGSVMIRTSAATADRTY